MKTFFRVFNWYAAAQASIRFRFLLFSPPPFDSVTNARNSVLRELIFFPWRAWVPTHSAIVESGRGRPFRGVLGSLTSTNPHSQKMLKNPVKFGVYDIIFQFR